MEAKRELLPAPPLPPVQFSCWQGSSFCRETVSKASVALPASFPRQ